MSREQLCAYLGDICEATLLKVCPVAPVDLGANVVRYARVQIDAWLATLPPRAPRNLRGLDGRDQDAPPTPAAIVEDEGGQGLTAAERAVRRASARAAAKGGGDRWKKAG